MLDKIIQQLYPQIINADMVVFSSPLYYHGFSAQIKTVIDRFHGIDDLIRGTGKKSALLVTAADNIERVTNGIVAVYEENLFYLKWRDCGQVLATGCPQREDIEKTDYPKMAYELGRSL